MRRYRLEDESLLRQLYDPEEYSNTQFFPIINALRKKLKVADMVEVMNYGKKYKIRMFLKTAKKIK